MEQLSNCPKCGSEYTYEDGSLLVCSEWAHEWSASEQEDLKVKGSSSVVKVGTKIKGIRLVESADDHNIDCKIPGVGAIKITPKFVKKYCNVAEVIIAGMESYCEDIRNSNFPEDKHCYHMLDGEEEGFREYLETITR